MDMNTNVNKNLELNSLKFRYTKLFFLKSFTQEYKICSDVVYAFSCFNGNKKCKKSRFRSKKVNALVKKIKIIDRDTIKEQIIIPNIFYLELIIEFESYINEMKSDRVKIVISILIPIFIALITGFITFITTFIKLTVG